MPREPPVDGPWIRRLLHRAYGPSPRDTKTLVTAQNSALGVGKTAFSVTACRLLEHCFDTPFTTDDACMGLQETMQRYEELDASTPSPMIVDELVGGGAGDARRAMAEGNVQLSHLWQVARKQRAFLFGTLPSASFLDKRLLELSDFRVVCQEHSIGTARIYQLSVNDFDSGGATIHHRFLQSLEFPNPESWDDPVFAYLDQQKDELIEGGEYDYDREDDEEDDDDDLDPMTFIRDEARRRRAEGDTYGEIAEKISNNPDTGEPFSEEAIRLWCDEVEKGSGEVPASAAI